MPTVVRVTTFNVNQFATPAHQRADLTRRMKDSDVVLCQETVDLDLAAFVKTQPGWASFQIRNGNDDGHANTAVLYRVSLGPVVETAVVDLGAAPHIPGHPNTGSRERFLVAVRFTSGEWFGSFHIFRQADAVAIPAMLSKVGAWCKAHPRATLGVDRNQAPPGLLENVTGLRWHGVGIDGLLSHLPVANVAEFPKGFSDHPGVRADVSAPDQQQEKPVALTPLQRILASLRAALAKFKLEGKAGKAKRAQAAIDALAPPKKPTPPPKPPEPPKPPTAPRGFMPGAIREAITAGSNDPAIIPCGVIQHIAVSNSADIRSIFTDGRGIESHFYILKDGTIIQYRSIFFEADANADGNSFGSPRRGFVSVEHQGGVGSDLGRPMPQAQLDAFHSVVLWVKSQADFPLRVTPAWNQPGVGYHAMFKEWNPNSHSCPGAARIKQFHDVTAPWLASQRSK